jgi:uncharacterized protein DUF6778
MKTAKTFLVLGLGLIVSACATVEVPTRNTPFEPLPDTVVTTPSGYEASSLAAAVGQVASADAVASITAGQPMVSVNSVVVRVPRTLKVSEANRYLPAGDIVWREDPIGDRYVQVQKIFQDAMAQGVAPLNGPASVDIDIQVKRFHALTEKARYTTGGVHSITFDLAIKHPDTGELLVPVRTIRADLDAFGGKQALQAEARGLTQKVRIVNHLAEVIRQELSNPEGYKNASLGFYQLLNNM